MTRRSSRSIALRPWLPILVALTLLAAACGKDDQSNASATTTTAAPATTTTAKLAGDMTVLAAASLTDSFQAKAGAPADVFASADDAIMKKTTDTGAAQDARPFTSRPT
ncbi:MAG: hypothetical protein QOI86_4612 [Actinomycetota bacterium]|nr:hypothetical protein [Actinomycetota bacterium]